MPKIKEVYEYNNGSWENGTPIGADASNVDVALSDSTSTRDLQSVLGNVSVSDPSIKTQLTGKVNSNSGDIKDTVVSVLDPSSATDTSENIDSTDVIVAAGESQYTMWSKFNTFRKRVSNKFNNFLISSVEDVVTPSSTKTYSQAALNNYFADVIGYKTDADIASIGSVADQLSTLNNNAIIDKGYEGIFSYIIYQNGLRMCWGRAGITVTQASDWHAYGNGFASKELTGQTFPTNLFPYMPFVVVSVTSNNASGTLSINTPHTNIKTGNMSVVRPGTSAPTNTTAYTFHIIAFGQEYMWE